MRLTLPASDVDLARREQMLAAHPGLKISAGTGHWQAEIAEPPAGNTIITRHTLGELLDRLGQVLPTP